MDTPRPSPRTNRTHRVPHPAPLPTVLEQEKARAQIESQKESALEDATQYRQLVSSLREQVPPPKRRVHTPLRCLPIARHGGLSEAPRLRVCTQVAQLQQRLLAADAVRRKLHNELQARDFTTAPPPYCCPYPCPYCTLPLSTTERTMCPRAFRRPGPTRRLPARLAPARGATPRLHFPASAGALSRSSRARARAGGGGVGGRVGGRVQ